MPLSGTLLVTIQSSSANAINFNYMKPESTLSKAILKTGSRTLSCGVGDVPKNIQTKLPLPLLSHQASLKGPRRGLFFQHLPSMGELTVEDTILCRRRSEGINSKVLPVIDQ